MENKDMNTTPHKSIKGNPAANHYPLEGLERLAGMFMSVPAGAGIAVQVPEFTRQLEEEAISLQLLMKTQAFALGREKEVSLLIGRYHASITKLLDHSLKKQELEVGLNEAAGQYYKLYIDAMEKLILFIDEYFPEHRSPEQRVPLVSLSTQRKDLAGRLSAIEKKILSHPEEMVAGELFRRLRRFAASGCPIPFKVRYRDLRYKEELLRRLEELQWRVDPDTIFTPVEYLLIYLNYNSKAFIRLLIRKVQWQVNAHNTIEEKLDKLLIYQKAFRQIHPKPGMVLNPGYHNLSKVINDWFEEEIRYLKEKPLPVANAYLKREPAELKVLQKVLVQLSSDQIGIILRAADEQRILVARSLSEVFNTIVPHLSTSNREHPSPKGMRTQAYVAEERDKAIAIETLQKIINKIKEY